MWYNATKEIDVQRAIERIKYFIKHEKTFELTEKKHIRSISQNSYLHLILSWYALEYGETLEYIKQEVFKKFVCKDLFYYEHINRKTGEVRDGFRSTADLNTQEMTTAIQMFRDFSVKQAGIYLPEPRDLALLNEIQIEVNNNKQYL